MSWAHIVTLLSILGFLLTAAGLIGVSFRVGRNAQTVSNYRDSADAWEKKSHSQGEELIDLQAKLIATEALVKKLQDRVQILENLVTGQAAISALTAAIDTAFANLSMRIDSVADQIRNDIRGQHG